MKLLMIMKDGNVNVEPSESNFDSNFTLHEINDGSMIAAVYEKLDVLVQ